MTITRRHWLTGSLAGLALPHLAHAQFKVDVAGVGATQMPVAIADFAGQAPQPVANIVRADLMRSGQFRISPQPTLSDQDAPRFAEWRGQDWVAVVGGSVTPSGGGWQVRCRIWDPARQVELGSESVQVGADELRKAAHRMADFIYQKLTGERGVFATRIAYVSVNGKNSHALMVADSDGEGAQVALRSREPLLSPSWSPDGQSLAYVSFENGKPEIFTQNLRTGARRAVGRHRGSNGAPAWSPDGQSLAMVLTLTGNSRIYLQPAAGGTPRPMASSADIDTEPVFTADGRSLVFTSDRGGAPQIYQCGVDGSGCRRLSFGSNYAVSPAISPDGKTLAYIARQGGSDVLTLQEAGGGARQVGSGPDDGHPSFAPNGRILVYAAVEGGAEVLKTVSVDGRVRTTLARSGGQVREPAWGPWTTPQ